MDENENSQNPAVSLYNDRQLQESSGGIENHQKEPFGTKSGPVVAPQLQELIRLWDGLSLAVQETLLTVARASAPAKKGGAE